MGMEKRRTFLINFAYFGLIALLVYLAVRYALPLAAPFVLAFLIAYLLRPVIRLLHKHLHLPEKPAAVLTVLAFYAAFGVLITLLSVKAFSGVVSLIGTLPTLYDSYGRVYFMDILQQLEAFFVNMEPGIATILDEIGTNLIGSLGNLISSLSVSFMGFATGVASAVPGLFVKLVLMIISTFFISIDYDTLTGFCLRQMSENAKTVFFQIKEYLVGTLWVCVRSYALIMSLTFVELFLGLSLIGLEHAGLIALGIAIFDILPVLGTGGIMIPWMILAALQGSVPLAVKLLVLYLVITVIRNIVEPKIVGSQLGLHPVVTLCSMFAGAQLFGAVGLFGFPIGLSLLRYLNEHGVIRIFR